MHTLLLLLGLGLGLGFRATVTVRVYCHIHTCFCHFGGYFFPGGPVLANTRMCPLWILFHRRLMEMVVSAGDIKCVKLQSYDH